MGIARGAHHLCRHASEEDSRQGANEPMMIGRTDEVDGHFVATRFVGLLVPTESLYFARRNGRSSNSEASSEGVRIQRDWRSIALGYGRVWLPIVAVALPFA